MHQVPRLLKSCMSYKCRESATFNFFIASMHTLMLSDYFLMEGMQSKTRVPTLIARY